MTPLGFLFFHRILLTDQKITKSMETMTNELTVIPGTIGMMGGMGMLKPEFIEDAVIVS